MCVYRQIRHFTFQAASGGIIVRKDWHPQKLCLITSFRRMTTSSCKACTSADCSCIFASSLRHFCCRFSTKLFCRLRHLVAAFRLSSSSLACLFDRGVIRLVVAFRRLTGVLRGRYVSLKSFDARDSRRRVCWRLRDTKLDSESHDGGLVCVESMDSAGEDDLYTS